MQIFQNCYVIEQFDTRGFIFNDQKAKEIGYFRSCSRKKSIFVERVIHTFIIIIKIITFITILLIKTIYQHSKDSIL